MPDTNHTNPENRPRKKQQIDSALKYSGIAFQLVATLLVGAFLGKRLDAYFELDRPYLTALFTLLGLFAGFYISLKDLLIKK